VVAELADHSGRTTPDFSSWAEEKMSGYNNANYQDQLVKGTAKTGSLTNRKFIPEID